MSRVLHLFCGPFPTVQGTQVLVGQTCEASARAGHEVHLLCYAHGNPPGDLPYSVHRAPDRPVFRSERSGPAWQKPLLDVSCALEARRLIARIDPDIVHAHHYEAILASALADPLGRVPRVFHLHALMGPELGLYLPRGLESMGGAIGRLMDASGHLLADRTIAVSDTVAGLARGMAIGDLRMDVLHPPYWTPPPVSAARTDREGILVVYTGNLDPYQGLDTLLEAMTILAGSEDVDIRLELITASDTERVSRRIRGMGLDRVVRTVSHGTFEEAWERLCQADIAVVPRRSPGGAPIKLVNALAAGVATLAHRDIEPGLRHRQEAYLVDAGNPEEIGAGLIELAKDASLRKRLGSRGREWVRRERSAGSYSEGLSRIYEELLRRW